VREREREWRRNSHVHGNHQKDGLFLHDAELVVKAELRGVRIGERVMKKKEYQRNRAVVKARLSQTFPT
jgi:hypothetical protein